MKAKEFCDHWGTTHDQLATLLRVGRTTVTTWISGARPETESVEQQISFWHLEFQQLQRLHQEFRPAIEIFEECRRKAIGTEFQAPASISELVILHWDELVRAAKIQIKRLQALREGDRPTDYEIQQLSTTGTPAEVLRKMVEALDP